MTSLAPSYGITTNESALEDFADFDLSFLPVTNENRSMIQPKLEPSTDYIPIPVFENSWSNGQLQQPNDTCNISIKQEIFNITLPPSPTPSDELKPIFNGYPNNQGYTHLFPPSPPDSSGAPSPSNFLYASSTSTLSIGSEDLNLMNTTNPEAIFSNQVCLQETGTTLEIPKRDCPTIRERLQDSTFQKRHNFKTSDTSFEDERDVLEQIPTIIKNTCQSLGISLDPQKWSCDDVQAWLKCMFQQYVLSPTPNLQHIFSEDGKKFSSLNEDDFTNRVKKDGKTLHALLKIWKETWNMQSGSYDNITNNETIQNNSVEISATCLAHPEYVPVDIEMQEKQFKMEMDIDMDMEMENIEMPSFDQQITQPPAQKLSETMFKQENKPQTNTGASSKSTGPITAKNGHVRHGSAHIHLWQFLKELLESPQEHGAAIRWIDRRSGVFKIEDSVRVARLWGRRKNRPAMNYDKLSRSIRQYYKKGIMQKTERSQRLVYQFCSPYVTTMHTNF